MSQYKSDNVLYVTVSKTTTENVMVWSCVLDLQRRQTNRRRKRKLRLQPLTTARMNIGIEFFKSVDFCYVMSMYWAMEFQSLVSFPEP